MRAAGFQWIKTWCELLRRFFELRRNIRLIQSSGYFDASWYLERNADVAEAGIDPVLHFLRHGAEEGRNPGPRFHTRWYLHSNPGVRESGVNPLVHYLKIGRSRGACPAPGHISHTLKSGGGTASGQVLVAGRGRDAGTPGEDASWITPGTLRVCYMTGAVAETYECGSAGAVTLRNVSIAGSLAADFVIPLVCAAPRIHSITVCLQVAGRPQVSLHYALHNAADRTPVLEGKMLIGKTSKGKGQAVVFDVDSRIFPVGGRCFLRMWSEDAGADIQLEAAPFHPRFYCGRKLLYSSFNIRAGLPAQHLFQPAGTYSIAVFGGQKDPECNWVIDVIRSEYSGADVTHIPFSDENLVLKCKNVHLAIFVNATKPDNLDIFVPELISAMNLHGTCTAYINVNRKPPAGNNDPVRQIADICHFYIELGESDYRDAVWTWRSNCHASTLPAPKSIESQEFPDIHKLQSHTAPYGSNLRVVIVSVLYNKSSTVGSFLNAIFRQNYTGKISVVLVDDCSPDHSAEASENLIRETEDTRPRNIDIRLLRNEENVGNCVSRNRGIAAVAGDIYIVIDCDCLINRDFVSAHVREHLIPPTEAVVGPLNLESLGQPAWEMMLKFERDPAVVLEKMNMQDNLKLDGFVNCITRNMSVKRSLLDQTGLFDNDFSYSAKKDSGFGWEDVELGARIYELGGYIRFTPGAFSLHQTHPSSVAEAQKITGSAKNFNRLLAKHPDMALYARRWTTETAGKILSWADQKGVEGRELKALSEQFQNAFRQLGPYLATRRPGARRLRVVSHRWHVPHQYELYKLNHDFTLLTGTGTQFTDDWSFDQRPLPSNVKFMDCSEFRPGEYDLAILHFDENVLCPDLSNNVLPGEWGDTFRWFLENVPLPKIAICHGTPPFVGQYGARTGPINRFEIHSDEVQRLKNALREIPVVCNSYQARQEWAFHRSTVIWHGVDPQDFPPGLHFKDLIGHGADRHRPHYRNADLYDRVLQHLPGTLVVENHQHAGARLLPRNDPRFSHANFRAWVDHLRQFKVYLNTTSRSPMPRARTEAMMCGVIPVSLRNHDVDHFVRNGVNGFYGETADELEDAIRFLCQNESARARMSTSARQTALTIFNHDRFLADWQSLLNSLDL